MRRTTWFAAAIGTVGFLLAAPQLWAVRLEQAKIIIEFNSTARDVGVQVFLDGEQWKRMRIYDPNGNKIFDVTPTGNLGTLGLTELFFEGEEPSLDDLPLDEFLALFPKGVYLFLGETVDGRKLNRRATFTHAIPDGPSIISPAEGAVVDPDHLVISWHPVTTPAGIEIAGYQVLVGEEFSVLLPATTTSVTIPPEFLAPGTEYALEVLAIEAGGNQTITESSFTTQ
jgi:hypothetical protein